MRRNETQCCGAAKNRGSGCGGVGGLQGEDGCCSALQCVLESWESGTEPFPCACARCGLRPVAEAGALREEGPVCFEPKDGHGCRRVRAAALWPVQQHPGRCSQATPQRADPPAATLGLACAGPVGDAAPRAATAAPGRGPERRPLSSPRALHACLCQRQMGSLGGHALSRIIPYWHSHRTAPFQRPANLTLAKNGCGQSGCFDIGTAARASCSWCACAGAGAVAVAVRWWRATPKRPRSARCSGTRARRFPRPGRSVNHRRRCIKETAVRVSLLPTARRRAETHMEKLLWRPGKSSHQRHIRFDRESHSGLRATIISARMTASALSRQSEHIPAAFLRLDHLLAISRPIGKANIFGKS